MHICKNYCVRRCGYEWLCRIRVREQYKCCVRVGFVYVRVSNTVNIRKDSNMFTNASAFCTNNKYETIITRTWHLQVFNYIYIYRVKQNKYHISRIIICQWLIVTEIVFSFVSENWFVRNIEYYVCVCADLIDGACDVWAFLKCGFLCRAN